MDKFVYLGVTISSMRGTEENVTRKIDFAAGAPHAHWSESGTAEVFVET